MDRLYQYKQKSVQALFPVQLRSLFHNVVDDCQVIREIRIRRNGPVQIIKNNVDFYLSETGEYMSSPYAGIILNEKDFNELFSHICKHSVYAFEKDFINGYLTVEGGHRIGVVGQTVWDGKEIKSIKYFNAFNIRISHEIKGVADEVLPYLYDEGVLKSTLVVSLPGCGKTTLLRDLVRKISNGSRQHLPQRVSLIDERSEIASCYLGIAQNDVGMHTDILDACPKAVGIMMVLRSMSPQVIAVDELGGREDYTAIQQAFYLGCNILATIHGTDYVMLLRNECIRKLLKDGYFQRVVFLEKPGGTIRICNEKGEVIKT